MQLRLTLKALTMNCKQLASDKHASVSCFYHSFAHQQRGVSLIELLVALVIGLVVSLAVYSVLNVAEGRKRTTTSVNDIDKAGAFAAYQLNKALASSGSGFTAGLNPNSGGQTKSATYSFGCRLTVSRGATTLLPRTFGAPFASVNNLRLVPIIIVNGGSSSGDVIVSMAGSGGFSESVINLTGSNAASLKAQTVAGLSANDKILLIETNNGEPEIGGNCLLDQVATGFNRGTGSTFDVPLAGEYHTGGASAYGASSIILNMGKAPQFNMYAVDDNNTLLQYHLLLPPASGNDANPSALIEGVFRMEAIYGISSVAGVYAWQAPTGNYAASALLAGTAAANARLQSITAVRVALVMRTNLAEKENVSAATITLFGDTGLNQTISGLDQKYRYRVLETTIPIRNALLALRP
jgi:type IV pilus assembly protein PilW